MVNSEILFIAEESLLVSRATCCYIRLYSFANTCQWLAFPANDTEEATHHLEVDSHAAKHSVMVLELSSC
jgi:hypothetical protein